MVQLQAYTAPIITHSANVLANFFDQLLRLLKKPVKYHHADSSWINVKLRELDERAPLHTLLFYKLLFERVKQTWKSFHAS